MTGQALVLIVEDNPRNLKLVRDVLDHAGHRTLAATSGEEGVRLAREHVPDLVLMDLQLPGMDGFAALGALRSEGATAAIPVIAVTALAMEQDRRRCRDAGFDGYLEKPIGVRALREQVTAGLAGTRA